MSTPNWIKHFAEIDQNQTFHNLIVGNIDTEGTQVYRGSNGKVYLATDHVSRGWDYQKLILSEINKKFGSQKHLPEIAYLGKYRDLDVFEMIYYRTLEPQDWDYEDANNQLMLVDNISGRFEPRYNDEELEELYSMELDEDARRHWISVVDSINWVAKFVSENYPNCYVEIDSWFENFALDYRGRVNPTLILLDVLSVRCNNE